MIGTKTFLICAAELCEKMLIIHVEDVRLPLAFSEC